MAYGSTNGMSDAIDDSDRATRHAIANAIATQTPGRAERAYGPERVFISGADAATAAPWTVHFAEPVSIIDAQLVREIYAHRGRRVVGRMLRQNRRKLQRCFGGELASTGTKHLRAIAARQRTRTRAPR
jgi:hypothetical protein